MRATGNHHVPAFYGFGGLLLGVITPSIRKGQEIFLFSLPSRPDLGATQPPIQ
jgi:hypothetical protein